MILLDTSALIWLTQGEPFRQAARAAIIDASNAGDLAVSATSAWEVGLLATRTGNSRVIFAGDERQWFARSVAKARLQVVLLDAETLLDAAYLPGDFHHDPSDRWIVATARRYAATLVTSDRRILAYADAGHVQVLRA